MEASTPKRGYELFDEWMKRRSLSNSKIAEDLKVSRQAVFRYRKGSLTPSPSRARIIAWMSFGDVPADIWPRRSVTANFPGPIAIREYVDKNKLSVSQLAEKCGLSQRTMSRYILGQAIPNAVRATKISIQIDTILTPKDFGLAA